MSTTSRDPGAPDEHGGVRFGSGAMFDRIARRYDLLNRVNSLGLDRRWRKRAVEALELEPGMRVLDLATGTADVALAIAARVPGTRIVGVDPSAGMLAVGREKVANLGLSSRIELVEGDALCLDFPDASFDRASMAFGIRNVPDRPRALREIARVLKPSGRLVILELSTPDRGPLASLARGYVEHVIPRTGAVLSGAGEYRYLERSIAAFPPPEEFREVMQAAGLVVLRIERLTFGACALFVAAPAEGASR